jgi:biotin-(acetyl-CoA carboxylase) ligase
MKHAPTFPPLLKGHRIPKERDTVKTACAMIAKQSIGAGDIVWSEDNHRLRFALVLEPEVERNKCCEMLYLVMVAFGDAAGAISPPEIAITYRWPGLVLVNEAVVGHVDLRLPESAAEAIPDWMVASVDIAIRPERLEANPGHTPEKTTMWDEGCGEITRTELLESVSRHIVNWIHTWTEDGFKPVHQQWTGRISEKAAIMDGLAKGEFVGLDDNGNALVREADRITSIDTLEALKHFQHLLKAD